jgi:hypothetical protein
MHSARKRQPKKNSGETETGKKKQRLVLYPHKISDRVGDLQGERDPRDSRDKYVCVLILLYIYIAGRYSITRLTCACGGARARVAHEAQSSICMPSLSVSFSLYTHTHLLVEEAGAVDEAQSSCVPPRRRRDPPPQSTAPSPSASSKDGASHEMHELIITSSATSASISSTAPPTVSIEWSSGGDAVVQMLVGLSLLSYFDHTCDCGGIQCQQKTSMHTVGASWRSSHKVNSARTRDKC